MLSNPFDRPYLQFLQYLHRRPAARLVHTQLGIWDVVIRKPARTWMPSLPTFDLKTYVSNASMSWRFIKEIHGLAPRQFWVHALNMAWLSSETLLTSYTSSQVYNAVMNHLYDEEVDTKQIAIAVGAQIGLIVTRNLIEKLVSGDERKLRHRIAYHFLSKSMVVNLHKENDSTDSTGNSTSHGRPFYVGCQFDDSPAIEAFENLTGIFTVSMKLVSQIFAIYRMLRQSSMDPAFLLVSVVQPLAIFSSGGSLHQQDFFAHCISRPFKRLMALYWIASSPESYSTDIKSDGIQDYIVTEFERCRGELGETNTERLYDQFRERKSLYSTIMSELAEGLDTLYFAIRLIFYPRSLTPSSYRDLQNASSLIYSTVCAAAGDRGYEDTFSTIRDVYKAEASYRELRERESQLLPYPRDGEKAKHVGMEIEFRDVTFRYPGTTKNALNNISFTIKPGQLVAIVGVNGSGKSSITNLFNRLYDPTEGEVLIDGLPLRSYSRADVRRSMAILRQMHILYPLSIRENIALGVPEKASSDDEVKAALECGGASSIVEKLSNNLDTVLDPVSTIETTMDLDKKEDDDEEEDPSLEELRKIKAIEITTDVSGGESQRLAASRTFLRMRAGGIRFLAADEPTSALDPEGEFELFRKLKHQRGEMTVVFVTHRFGHLTRDADLILCLKDGYLVEQGTHDELMAKGEVYFKLYEIQAHAFSGETDDQVAQIIDAGTE